MSFPWYFAPLINLVSKLLANGYPTQMLTPGQVFTGVMRDTVFCPVYCIRAPTILFLQQYVIICCFWGHRPNFPIIWMISQDFWSILKDFPIVFVNFGNFGVDVIKKNQTRDCTQNNTLGSLVNGNLSKSVGWTLKRFRICLMPFLQFILFWL